MTKLPTFPPPSKQNKHIGALWVAFATAVDYLVAVPTCLSIYFWYSSLRVLFGVAMPAIFAAVESSVDLCLGYEKSAQSFLA